MEYWFHIVNIALIIAILGFSLNLLMGFAGMVSLAHGALFGIGAYTAAIASVEWGVTFPVTILLAMIFTGGLAGLVGWPALRVRGEYLILLTLAVQVVAVQVFIAWNDVTGGTSGISGIQRPQIFGFNLYTPSDLLPLVGVCTLAAFVVSFWVGRAPFGRILRAIRENPSATLSIGKNVTYYRIAAFTLSGVVAGFGGGLYAHYQAFVSPGSFVLDEAIFLISVVVLGGLGNLFGTIVGAFLLASIPELLGLLEVGEGLVGVAQNFIYGSLLVVFMLFRPEGIIPEHFRVESLIPQRFRGGRSRRVENRESGQQGDGSADQAHVSEEQHSLDVGASQDSDNSTKREQDIGTDNEAVLVARDLHKSFGGVKPADGLHLTLRSGQVTALVGPNGAGKTTVFNLLTGYIRPDKGTVNLAGQELTGLSPWQCVRRGLARSFQDTRIFSEMTVLDNVMAAIPEQPGEKLGSLFLRPLRVWNNSKINADRAVEYLELVGIAERADRVVSSLSFGEQKLVGIARLLATEADVLLLDEPAAGIDQQWVRRILEQISKLADEGKAICIVEHNLDVIRTVAHNAYFMNVGKIVAEGTPESLMEDKELAAIYFGTTKKAGDENDE